MRIFLALSFFISAFFFNLSAATNDYMTNIKTIIVDDDAPGDPKICDTNESDPNEDGTSEHPFDSIQEAINMAPDGASVIIHTGIYMENIDFLGKNIQLIGNHSHDPNGSYAILDGNGTGPVLKFTNGENQNCLVEGIVITCGKSQPAGAVYCVGSSPTIANCLIVGNQSSSVNGSAVYCLNSHTLFTHCTISNNFCGNVGAALTLIDSNVTLTHSILWGNTPKEISIDEASEPLVSYTNIAGGWPGHGNIDQDPLFVKTGYWADLNDSNSVVNPPDHNAVWITGDYHLLTQSPCIDMGDPSFSSTSEINDIDGDPRIINGRVDIGCDEYRTDLHESEIIDDYPIYFPDENFKAAVEAELGINDPTPADMLILDHFECASKDVVDILGLGTATNLLTLSLRDNDISDISPLSSLTKLEQLNLSWNKKISNISAVSYMSNLWQLDCHWNLISDLSPLTGLYNLRRLVLRRNRVSDLSGLANLTNLRKLNLEYNQVQDLSPLSNLINLDELVMWNNQISDISVLAKLKNLTYLSLAHNQIDNISALSNLDKLKRVWLQGNHIRDISPLTEHTSLLNLDLTSNPLNEAAYTHHIPEIILNNPGINIKYDLP